MIYQKLTFDFNNKLLKIILPLNANNVEGQEILDPNDPARTIIHRDCTNVLLFLVIIYVSF